MLVDPSVTKLPCYMITVHDHPVSEQYFSYVSRAWKHVGLDVSKHKAVTPSTLPEKDLFLFKPNVQKKFLEKGYKKSWTPSEKACVYSHFFLWQRCVEKQERMLIFEQDAFPIMPHLIKDDPEKEVIFIAPGTAGYILDPKFAEYWLGLILKSGLVSGMYGQMYHCAFRDKRKIYTYKRGFPAVQIHDKRHKLLVDHFTGTEAEQDFKDYQVRNNILEGHILLELESDPIELLNRIMSKGGIVPVPIEPAS